MKMVFVMSMFMLLVGNCFGEEKIDSSAHFSNARISRHFKKAVIKDGNGEQDYVKAVTPVSGIVAGFVIVHGHGVKPPYQVETENGQTLINRIPVGPVTTRRDITSAQAKTLIDEANKIFCERGQSGDYGASAGDILALFMKSIGTVISAKWNKGEAPPKGVLLVRWKDNIRGPAVRFNPAACATHSPDQRSRGIRARSEAVPTHNGEFHSKSVQKNLEAGKLLVFTHNGEDPVLPQDAKVKLDQVMADERLDVKTLLEKLRNLGFSHSAALEILRNYKQE